MQILRTPEKRFANLPDYTFTAQYIEVPDERYGPLRMHYIDEGERDAPVILLTPTQGSWVYIYRHMIPLLVAAGFRTIAPDYIGFRPLRQTAKRRGLYVSKAYRLAEVVFEPAGDSRCDRLPVRLGWFLRAAAGG